MDTLDYILKKFNITITDNVRMPYEIPDFGRNGLAVLFNELGFKVGAEIGVLDGTYSQIMCEANPGVKLYCIDAWKRHKGYLDYTRSSTFSNAHERATKILAPYNCELIRKFSMDAVKKFEDESLDFVYIDGNHDFQNVTNDIVEWSKKVRKGGIIAGHDYSRHKGPSFIHVHEVLNAYTQAYKIRPWFILGSMEVVPGQVRDAARSWMFIKK